MPRDCTELSRYADSVRKIGFKKLAFIALIKTRKNSQAVARDIAILKSAFRFGYADTANEYGISRQRVHQICKKYSNLAKQMEV